MLLNTCKGEKIALKNIAKTAQEDGYYTLQKFCPLAAGNVRNDLPVDRLTVIFMTVVPLVDCPVDRDWIQRATALCRSTGTISREQSSLDGRPAHQPKIPCTSVDWTGRPTSAAVDRPVDWDWIQRAAALCRSTGALSREQSSLAVDRPTSQSAVSYTHLTLPTIYSV